MVNCKLEHMEARRLLSAAVVDSVLQINGTDLADAIAISVNGNAVVVRVNDDTTSFNAADVTAINVQAGLGDDNIALDPDILAMTTIDGGDGLNALDLSGTDSPLSITTEQSNRWQSIESLKTGGGNDDIDLFSQFDTGIQMIDAGAGDDTVMLFRTAPGATVNGGAGDDTLQVSDPGHDAVYIGGDGNDLFQTYRSSNTARDFNGGAGIDTVDYSPFNTGTLLLTIDNHGGDGVQDGDYDRLDNVHTDVEEVIGTPLDDTITGSSNNETILGGDGDDVINGNGGTDSLDGGSGNNTILPSSPGSTAGDSSLTDDSAKDVSTKDVSTGVPAVVSAKTVASSVVVGTLSKGILRIAGTASADHITVLPSNGSKSLTVTLNGNTATFDVENISEIRIDGQAGNDRINLDPSITLATRINGGDGNDTISGDGGVDRIDGGNGNDYINANGGNDIVYGDSGNDRLYGGSGKDRLYAGSGKDLLRGGDGKDSLMVRTAKRVDLRDNKGDRIILSLV